MKRKVPESLKFKDYLIAAVELEGVSRTFSQNITIYQTSDY